MNYKLGIRREDKNQWERRVPIAPRHIQELKNQHNIDTIIQPSKIRAFSNEEYKKTGAIVKENLSQSSVIFAIKEMPIDFFEPDKTYVFFSHTIKGQKYNMPMLKRLMDLGCNLIDYEKIMDRNGRRLVFFGRYAGLAGMLDALWAFGQRLSQWEHIENPFKEIKQTIHYKDLTDIKKHLTKVGKKIKTEGLTNSLTPLIVGFAGYGNVSKGAQEILDILPVKEIKPYEIKSIYENPSNKYIYKVIFKEEDMVEPTSPEDKFDLQDYYNNPDKYHSIFENYIPYLSILMNCIYWNTMYPRLVTKEYIKKSFTSKKPLILKVIGDISCDINGAIEFTLKITNSGNPVFVYNPITDKVSDGFEGEGIVVIAVDNLPCELPRESSEAFSEILFPFVPKIIKADYSVEDFNKLDLPFEIKNAVILYHGRLTPNYRYINKFL